MGLLQGDWFTSGEESVGGRASREASGPFPESVRVGLT